MYFNWIPWRNLTTLNNCENSLWRLLQWSTNWACVEKVQTRLMKTRNVIFVRTYEYNTRFTIKAVIWLRESTVMCRCLKSLSDEVMWVSTRWALHQRNDVMWTLKLYTVQSVQVVWVGLWGLRGKCNRKPAISRLQVSQVVIITVIDCMFLN